MLQIYDIVIHNAKQTKTKCVNIRKAIDDENLVT